MVCSTIGVCSCTISPETTNESNEQVLVAPAKELQTTPIPPQQVKSPVVEEPKEDLEVIQSLPKETVERADVELLPSAIDDPVAVEVVPLDLPNKIETVVPDDAAMAPQTTSSTDKTEVDLGLFDAQNVFNVTVAPKQAAHPNFGKGHTMGFIVNERSGATLVVLRGQSYVFNVKTNIKHDFYLSLSDVGWGASAYVDGVSGQYTFRGRVTFKPTDKTPNELYYQCRNHQSMGGRIVVVNTEAEKQQILLELNHVNQAQDDALVSVVSQGSVVNQELKSQAKQKLSYANLLLRFKTKGVAESEMARWQDALSAAQQAFDAEDWNKSITLAAATVEAIQLKPRVQSDEALKEQTQEYDDALASLQSFEDSFDDAMKRAVKQNTPPEEIKDYDRRLVESLKAEAVQAAQNHQYETAIRRLTKAERQVTLALKDMLGSQTIVYEVKFDTPEAEFKYELNRYKSYKELIPVAIDVKKPRPQSIKLMRQYEEKSVFFKQKAVETADKGDFAQAIIIIRDAVTEVRRGLTLLGVTM